MIVEAPGDAASVDEILAWLRDALCPMEIEVYLDGILPTDGFDVYVNTMADYEGNVHYSKHSDGRTLLDALRRIVNQVIADPPHPITITCIRVAP